MLAMEKTKYYRSVFHKAGFHPGDLKTPQDIAGLPLISKQTLRESMDDMCASDINGRDVDYVSTGGSSGEPFQFYINANRSAAEFAYLLAGWERVGYQLDTVQAVIRGQIVPEDASGLRHEYDPILRRHSYSNFHMTDENICRYLRHIAGIGPCYLHVYPSSVASLARFIEQTGEAVPANIRGILAGSENVYPDDRDRVERVFGLRYFSWYGHSEKLVLACECEHSSDYHVWPTYGYFELLGEDGEPVRTPGQQGEIVGTGFINTVVPFIRYRTGDYATYGGEQCAGCGREHRLIRNILGHRTQEMLVAVDSSLISWTSLNMHDDTFERVRQFQFFQKEKGKAVLRLVPASGFDDSDRLRIKHNLDRKLDGRITFNMEIVDEIQLTARGKSVYVEQQIDFSIL